MTTLVSLALIVAGQADLAAVMAGFVPGTVTGTVIAPSGIALLPFWITPLTATLVHGGYLHLGFNLLMLVYCGLQVERALGWRLLVLLYGIGAYGAALGEMAFDWNGNTPMVGASGAISALLAAYAMLYSEREVRAIGPIPGRLVHAAWLAAAWIGVQMLTGIASAGAGFPIAIGAHVGGFVAGLVLTRPLLRWRYRQA